MAILVKNVSWASVINLGCTLCSHCGEEVNYDGVTPVEEYKRERWEFTQAFTLGQRCPMNFSSFGGREAILRGESAKESEFVWLKTKQELDRLGARLRNAMYGLKEQYSHCSAVEEWDQFLHTLGAFAEKDVDCLIWQSATSGARIICVRKTRRSSRTGTTHSWVAEFHDGHKPSHYAALWAAMRE